MSLDRLVGKVAARKSIFSLPQASQMARMRTRRALSQRPSPLVSNSNARTPPPANALSTPEVSGRPARSNQSPATVTSRTSPAFRPEVRRGGLEGVGLMCLHLYTQHHLPVPPVSQDIEDNPETEAPQA